MYWRFRGPANKITHYMKFKEKRYNLVSHRVVTHVKKRHSMHSDCRSYQEAQLQLRVRTNQLSYLLGKHITSLSRRIRNCHSVKRKNTKVVETEYYPRNPANSSSNKKSKPSNTTASHFGQVRILASSLKSKYQKEWMLHTHSAPLQ